MAKRSKLPKGYFWRDDIIWCRTDPILHKRVSTECRDPKELKAWERKRKADAADPRYAAAHKETLCRWVAEIIEIKRVDKSAATVKIYEQKLGHFIRIWGENFPLIDITPTACDVFTKQRRTEASDHTIVKEFSALTQLLKAAKRAGCYPHDISALRPLTLAPRYVPRTRHLDWNEIDLLLEETGDKLGALVSVIVTTGARLSEAMRFDPAIDLKDWVAHIRGTKTDDSDRFVPVLQPFRPRLTAVLGRLPVGSYKNNLRRDLLAACKRAGIDSCTPNDLRRTFASQLVAAGVDKEVVRRLMGHKTSRMVEFVYGKIDPKELEKLAEPAFLALGPSTQNVTKNVTVIEVKGDSVISEPNSGANSEIRTRDLRFTKPISDQPETSESALIRSNGHLARHSETQPDTARSVTEKRHSGPEPDRAIIRRALDALQAWDEWGESDGDLEEIEDLEETIERLRAALTAAGYLDAKGEANG